MRIKCVSRPGSWPTVSLELRTEKMMNRRISCLLFALALLAPFVAPSSIWAQSYPNRPVRLVVPFPAGGPADALGRMLADQLNKMWGQPVIVENRGGAGGNL